ncbi:hypothetical protein F2Q68_00037878 [Brassica cretica]|uniref:Uncharacterized protein n=1 Tax=Brassica cretica TaxID=69181 RepID=A0A8S9GZ14_BRACR|nr:hypothetical protein F2Q68_00037878 [Brassica cretica]
MKLNGIGSSSSSSSSSPSAALASSSSTSNSIGSSSSSASTSRFHSVQNQSPEEIVEAARSAAALAVKAAKAARAIANEKALISSKAIAAAKRALELVDSFPKEAMADCKEKKHVSVDNLYSKDLAFRLQRAIERRSSVTGYVNGIAGVVDSDSSYDGLESNRKAFKPDEVDWIRTPGKEKAEEQRRGRVKLKKFPLSIRDSTDQENGVSSLSPVPVAQPQNKAIRS